MPKIQKGTSEKKAFMSDEMIKNCKSDIAKFGFTGPEYLKFLISVKAMLDAEIVVQFPNTDINKYHKEFLEKNECDLDSDMFVLNNFKIKASDSNGHPYETGYFCPRSFWDAILDSKLST